MEAWTCRARGQADGADYGLCWHCGTGIEGAPPPAGFGREDASGAARPTRAPDCMRCGGAMRALGRLRLHEGSQAAPFLLGNLGELMVRRLDVDAIACTGCGKLEFFLPQA